jgi:adenosine deaminase
MNTLLMSQPVTDHFLKGLPKAELHVHFEGALDAETWYKISKRNGVPFPFPTVADAKKAFVFKDLLSFLVLADGAVECLMNEEDFYEVAWDYIVHAQKDNVRHIELTWGPTLFTPRGVTIETQINGLMRAFDRAAVEFDMTGGIIWTFIKSHSTELNMSALKDSAPFKHRILGVGMAGAEVGNPPHKYVTLYQQAKEMGYRLTGHVGEQGGSAQHVWEALELLGLERIDHGVSIKDDPKLMEHIAKNNIHLTMCPCSNLCLNVYDHCREGPYRRFYDAGISFSLNSDDPPFFNNYMYDNYKGVNDVEEFKWTRADWLKIASEGFKNAWLDDVSKEKYLAEVVAWGELSDEQIEAQAGSLEKILCKRHTGFGKGSTFEEETPSC